MVVAPTATEPNDRDRNALEAARRYYIDNVSTPELAAQFNVSRSTVSRWISLARERGWVRIQIDDPHEHAGSAAEAVVSRFGLQKAVAVPARGKKDTLAVVASRAAVELNQLVQGDMIIGIAWGTTMSAIASRVRRLDSARSVVVQLNGAGTVEDLGIGYVEDILGRFVDAWGATGVVFPVPAFFDYSATRDALWNERSINRVREMQRNCDLAVFSVGSALADVPSRVYGSGYLAAEDVDELRCDGVVGDIATYFFRSDGSHEGIPLNSRASGLPIDQLTQIPMRMCVASGVGKAEAVAAALRGGYVTHLVADEELLARVVELSTV